MVICIIALPVLAILGIFSLRYRELAKEAFRCLFRTATFKPCDSALDIRIKAKFTAKLMWWPGLARAFYKSFAVLSWIFVILMLLSVYFSGQGIYNYVKYGNCNGPNNDQFCIFNIVKTGQPQCSATGVEKHALNVNKVDLSLAQFRGSENASLIIIEYGCFSCKYTAEAEPVVQKILNDYPNVQLAYLDVPLEIHPYSLESSKAALCAKEQGKYWEYHDLLFERQSALNESTFGLLASELGLNSSKFEACLAGNSYDNTIKDSSAKALEVGIYGTPTFFINAKSYVGPQSYTTLKNAIEGALK